MHTSSDILRVGQPLSQARGALLLLHGRGSSPQDIVGLTRVLNTDGLAVLAPAAPGSSWYPQRFLAPLEQNEPALSTALGKINTLIDEVIATGLPASRIALVGFSQGACLSLEHAVRSPRRYGFVAALSGALIGPLSTPRPSRDLSQLPVLLGCAEADAHIPLPHVEHSAATLRAMNAKVTKQIYAGSAHSVFPQEITWLETHLNVLRDS